MIAILSLLFVLALFALRWRDLTRINMLAGFFLFSMVFNGALLLSWPFLRANVEDVFDYVSFELIQDVDFFRALLIFLLGLASVTLSYLLARRFLGRSSSADLLSGRWMPASGIRVGLTYLLTILCILYVLFNWLALRGYVVSAMVALLHGEFGGIVEFRNLAAANYAYVLIVWNTLPLLSACLLVVALAHRSAFHWTAFSIVFAITAFGLILTFQKSPLLHFLLALGFVALLARQLFRSRTHAENATVISEGAILRLGSRRLLLLGSAAFFVLTGFYVFYTAYRFEESLGQTIVASMTDAFVLIFSRLGIPQLFYAYYFPAVDAHYKFANVGMLASALDFPMYADTVEVFRYFTGMDEGTAAISALFDFYGQFGFIGTVVGACFLGVLFALIDSLIEKMPRTGARLVAIAFALQFAYMLTSANIFRSAMGYGGLIHLALVLLLTRNPAAPIRR